MGAPLPAEAGARDGARPPPMTVDASGSGEEGVTGLHGRVPPSGLTAPVPPTWPMPPPGDADAVEVESPPPTDAMPCLRQRRVGQGETQNRGREDAASKQTGGGAVRGKSGEQWSQRLFLLQPYGHNKCVQAGCRSTRARTDTGGAVRRRAGGQRRRWRWKRRRRQSVGGSRRQSRARWTTGLCAASRSRRPPQTRAAPVAQRLRTTPLPHPHKAMPPTHLHAASGGRPSPPSPMLQQRHAQAATAALLPRLRKAQERGVGPLRVG